MTDNTQNLNQIEIELADTQGKQLAGLLDAQSKRLSMRTLKQLEDARMQAVKAHAQAQTGTITHADGTLGRLFSWAEHHRAAAAGMALTLVFAGLLVMQNLGSRSVDTDTLLLGAELPPEAFVDQGFEPSLNRRVSFDQTSPSTTVKI